MPEVNKTIEIDLPDVLPDDILQGRALPAGMLEDFWKIAGMSNETIQRISSSLVNEPGILNASRVKDILAKCVDEESAIAVTRTVFNLSVETIQRTLAILDRYRGANSTVAQWFTDDVTLRLGQNLRSLVQNQPAIELMRKSQRLLRDTGNELLSALFVCDLRPVFDDHHKKVEGLLPVANFRIEYAKQNSEREFFELALSEDELDYLINKCEDAKSKLEVLQRDYIGGRDEGK